MSRKLQEAIDLWEIGARASGGEIVTDPTKSWYCLIDFEWNEGEWSYKSEMDNVDITVKMGMVCAAHYPASHLMKQEEC